MAAYHMACDITIFKVTSPFQKGKLLPGSGVPNPFLRDADNATKWIPLRLAITRAIHASGELSPACQ